MCDSLCVLGPSGLLFANSSDRPPNEPQVFEAFGPRSAGGTLRTQYLEIPDAGASAFVGSRPTWLWGVEHGLNEHGVAIGNEKLYTTGRPAERAPALLGMDLVRLGLERARTADEALAVVTDLLEEHGQGGSGEADQFAPYDSSFLIADARGAWILETCDRTWAARPVGGATEPGAAISNRITLGTDWTRGSPDLRPGTDFGDFLHPRIPTAIADHRLAATRACVARGPAVGPAEVVATLRDHGTGPWGAPGGTGAPIPPPTSIGTDFRGVTVCMHAEGTQNTTASMICTVPTGDPAGARAWVALGSPCVSVYVPFHPVDGVPPGLSDPTRWARLAVLRNLVESDPERIAAVRARLDPIEAAAWRGDLDPESTLAALDDAVAQLTP